MFLLLENQLHLFSNLLVPCFFIKNKGGGEILINLSLNICEFLTSHDLLKGFLCSNVTKRNTKRRLLMHFNCCSLR